MAIVAGRSYDNFTKMPFVGVGAFEVPDIFPCSLSELNAPTEWVGFDRAIEIANPGEKGVHFF